MVGARPQFVKLAPVHKALSDLGVEHLIVHTGQHYDSKLSDVFFEEFDIPAPVANLAIGSHSHAVQTAKIIESLEPHIVSQNQIGYFVMVTPTQRLHALWSVQSCLSKWPTLKPG